MRQRDIMSSSKPLYSLAIIVSADEMAFTGLIRARIYKIFVWPKRPASGPTHFPVQWILGLFLQDKAAGAWRWPRNPHLASRLRKSRAVTIFPLWAFMFIIGWKLLWTDRHTTQHYPGISWISERLLDSPGRMCFVQLFHILYNTCEEKFTDQYFIVSAP
jgi:hypothetical protein